MGKDEEFTAFVKRFRPRLIVYIKGFGLSTEDAEQIAQESFTRLWEKGIDSVPPEKWRFWLMHVARNLALDMLTERQKLNKHNDEVTEGLQRRTLNPDEEYLLAELFAEITELLNTLSDRCRAAFLLRVLEGCSYKEIADRLQMPEGMVAQCIHRARNRARLALKP